jgi:hypothetical protein
LAHYHLLGEEEMSIFEAKKAFTGVLGISIEKPIVFADTRLAVKGRLTIGADASQ